MQKSLIKSLSYALVIEKSLSGRGCKRNKRVNKKYPSHFLIYNLTLASLYFMLNFLICSTFKLL